MKFIYFLLIINSIGSALLQVVANNQNTSCNGNQKPSFNLTKTINIQMESNLDQWNPALRELIKTHIEEKHEGNQSIGENQANITVVSGNHEINVDRTFTQIDQKGILNHLETLTNQLADMQEQLEKTRCTFYSNNENQEVCRQLVGLSKLPICDVIENKRYDNINKINNTIPKNCKEIQQKGQNKSGIYEIQPKGSPKPFMVLCDMQTKGGGWTHIQKRIDGSLDFYREWRDYKFGFGNLNREFWIGLENIYHITGSEVNELLVEILDQNKIAAYAGYKSFGITSELDGYALNVLTGFSGDAGDSLTTHVGSKFTTKDLDQDLNDGNCAQLYLGGWWYKSCHISNLNGKYFNVRLPNAYKFKGLHWKSYKGHDYCHSGSRMLVRPVKP